MLFKFHSRKNVLKDIKFSLQFYRFLLINNKDLYSKLKYNNYIIKLIKNVKKINEIEYKKENDVSNLDLSFSYLYKNVIIKSKNEEKHYDMQNGLKSYNLCCNYEIITNKNDTKNSNDSKKIFYYIINSINICTSQHILMILYSFLIYNINIEYLKRINEHVLNNIYNFKTNELILIQMFYAYFEIKSSRRKNDLSDILKVNLINGSNTNSFNTINHSVEIYNLVKDLIKYGNYLFYKRKQSLLLNDISDILFLYYNYNIYNKELFDYFVASLDSNLNSINVANLKILLKEKKKIKNYNDLNNFNLIINCYYYISCMKIVELKKIFFLNFYDFLLKNHLLHDLSLHHLLLLLKITENIQNIDLKLSILNLIDNILKLSNDIIENNITVCKNFEKCLNVFNSIFSYCEKFNYINKNEKVDYNLNTRNYENGFRNSTTDGCIGTNYINNKINDSLNEYNEKDLIKNNYMYNNLRCINNDSLNNNNNNSINHCFIEDSINIKNGEQNKSIILHEQIKFLDGINQYIRKKCIDNEYLKILLTSVANTSNYKNILIYFLDILYKNKNIDILLYYIDLLCTYINNIYVLLHVDYFYKCIIIGKYKDFTSDKIIILISCLFKFIHNNNYINSINKNNFDNNNKEFFLLLYKNNFDMYEYVKNNLLNMNLNEIKYLDEFLFHLTFKNMIKNTFICLEKNIFYLYNLKAIDKLLYYFLNIYIYYSKYSPKDNFLAVKISTLLFHKIFTLNFLNIYKNSNNKFHDIVKKILISIRLDKDLDEELINYILNIYFQNDVSFSNYNEDIFKYITNILEDVFKVSFDLKYKNDVILFDNSNCEFLKIISMKSLIENNFNNNLVNLIFLINNKINFNNLFNKIKEYLYSYAI
ncbi:conserved Plasmodium protein, unknown function [Plasmodium gallinaceum]|uniref:Uncharacterized protein n=1 Tax=Plasmodium gallinaceum TaxID=5849 RepID=A0A1J1GQK4_PLAGA|nr:conserved Plasmodium protein, unknown function [Plasmodium gallinaceum]CRG94791.1 conserved Plasmodium protein, unknown function [Plasmodium gallinaceum]